MVLGFSPPGEFCPGQGGHLVEPIALPFDTFEVRASHREVPLRVLNDEIESLPSEVERVPECRGVVTDVKLQLRLTREAHSPCRDPERLGPGEKVGAPAPLELIWRVERKDRTGIGRTSDH